MIFLPARKRDKILLPAAETACRISLMPQALACFSVDAFIFCSSWVVLKNRLFGPDRRKKFLIITHKLLNINYPLVTWRCNMKMNSYSSKLRLGLIIGPTSILLTPISLKFRILRLDFLVWTMKNVKIDQVNFVKET